MSQKYNYEIFDKLSKIEQFLEDDISKIVIRHRVLANLTNNVQYIYDLLSEIQTFDFSKAYESFGEIDEHYGIYNQMDVLAWIQSKKEKKDIVLFGAGNNSEFFLNYLKMAGVSVKYVLDNNSKVSFKCGIPVITVEEHYEIIKNSYIIISSLMYKMEMSEQLKRLGVQEDRIYSPDENSLISYSRDVYFDSSVWKPDTEEIFIDAGCYNLYSARQFAKWCPSYKEIYAFEPDKENFGLCKNNQVKYKLNNVHLFNAGLWKDKAELSFSHEGDLGAGSRLDETGTTCVNVINLDEVLQGKKCTLIKMDIEGAELAALEGARETIKKWKPRLAICIYHKPEDVFDIPLYIKQLVPEYKFKIRHYSTYFFDTVLYAYL